MDDVAHHVLKVPKYKDNFSYEIEGNTLRFLYQSQVKIWK